MPFIPERRHRLVKETVAHRGFIEYTLDLLSIPEYVIKKGRPHGHRYGKCEEVGFVSRVHLLSGEVRSVTTALKVVEEVQEEVQEIEDE